jgi:23S rRNA (adenine2503-C2)-methyltransferase
VSEVVAIRKPAAPIPSSDRARLRGLPRDELRAFVRAKLGGPAYRADQLFAWLHAHRASDFEGMTNLPKAARAALALHAELPNLAVDAMQTARDGTRKLRLRTAEGDAIETVLIPNEERGLTQCVSSMVGCSLTCAFCATASLGFRRNLAAWEIVDQVYRAQALLAAEAAEAGEAYPQRITNLVFMGMGEPLHNYNQVKAALAILTDPEGAAIAGRRITVSTAGFVPGIERFAREGLADEVGLAISLNATTDAVRDVIMPINTRWPIAALLQAVRDVPTPKRRDLTFEYVLLADVNDSDDDVERLAQLLADIEGHVNVIPWNPHPHAPFRRPSDARIRGFLAGLRARGVTAYVRTPRGDDIAAACGQLALEAGLGPQGLAAAAVAAPPSPAPE